MGGTVNLRASEVARTSEPFKVRLVANCLTCSGGLWTDRHCPKCRFVFHDQGGTPIGDFKKAWRTASGRSDSIGLLIHDMRRSAAQQSGRSGGYQAMCHGSSPGHLTHSMWRRYNIIGDDDLEDEMERVSAYNRERSVETPKIVPPQPRRKVA